jgi:hypothetical protein
MVCALVAEEVAGSHQNSLTPAPADSGSGAHNCCGLPEMVRKKS